MWKPAIVWRIYEIVVLSPSSGRAFAAMKSRASVHRQKDYRADADRAQRNTVALRDVDYVVTASFQMTSPPTLTTSAKFEEMFERRFAKG